MTSIRLNEWLREFPEYIGKDRIKAVLAAPLLTLKTLNTPITKEDSDAIRLLDETDGLARCPFKLFRFSFKIGEDSLCGFIERKRSLIQFFALHQFQSKISRCGWLFQFHEGTAPFSNTMACDIRIFDTKTKKEATKEYLSVLRDRNDPEKQQQREEDRDKLAELNAIDDPVVLAQKIKEDKARVARLTGEVESLRHKAALLHGVADFTDSILAPNLPVLGKVFEGTNAKEEGFDSYTNKGFYCLLLIGCYEYLAPYNFMALVRPNKEGKSVEWMRAREHYTIIHRHHPANNASVSEGVVISESDEQTLSRIAHSRRAHTRLLRSAKFTFKQGQRVFVRACWVGPQEWKDEGGRQIYQILTPVAQELAA